mmetsp:Transcript_6917/g.30402  ORF Transcript_6917/g.30402 Transcript_6917/m.30402 type:complete len:244 (+) Transcript_6917:1509-2240(+)
MNISANLCHSVRRNRVENKSRGKGPFVTDGDLSFSPPPRDCGHRLVEAPWVEAEDRISGDRDGHAGRDDRRGAGRAGPRPPLAPRQRGGDPPRVQAIAPRPARVPPHPRALAGDRGAVPGGVDPARRRLARLDRAPAAGAQRPPAVLPRRPAPSHPAARAGGRLAAHEHPRGDPQARVARRRRGPRRDAVGGRGRGDAGIHRDRAAHRPPALRRGHLRVLPNHRLRDAAPVGIPREVPRVPRD